MTDAPDGTGGRTAGPAPRPGPGGGRRERREQTRAALLAAAQRLWAERGIHGASLDDIAASAGLTKGAVYSNFAGKTDLLLALLERYTEERLGSEVCDELRDTARPADQRLEQVGKAFARRLSGDDSRLVALLLMEFWLYGMRDYAAGWRIADWHAERRGRLAQCLGDVEGIAAADRATLAIALDFGLAFQHLLDPERVPADLYATGLRLLLGRSVS
ncbi:TetR/AcrR family transcriptional regulator [Spirillospora sp. CA-253888]